MDEYKIKIITIIGVVLLLTTFGACEKKEEPSNEQAGMPATTNVGSGPITITDPVSPEVKEEAAAPASAPAQAPEPEGAVSPTETTSIKPGADPINVALAENGGRVVLHSSQYNTSTWAASNLIDGGTTKGWSGNSRNPQFVVIGFDQEGPVEIVDVVINPYTKESKRNWAKQVEIEVSLESPYSGYRGVGTMTLGNEPSDQVQSFDPPMKTRYVKLKFLENYGGSYMQIGEIMIMGHRLSESGGPMKHVNLAASENGAKVAKSTSEYDKTTWAANNLIDGGTNKGWSSNSKNPQEILIELPGEQPSVVSAVAINPYSKETPKNWVKGVEVLTSATSSYKGYVSHGSFELAPDADYHLWTLPEPARAKYVKFKFTSNHGGSYFQAGEIAVFAK